MRGSCLHVSAAEQFKAAEQARATEQLVKPHPGEPVMEDIGEVIGLAFHLAAIAFLLLARKEFWAKVRRAPPYL